jgi:hypothetical protein
MKMQFAASLLLVFCLQSLAGHAQLKSTQSFGQLFTSPRSVECSIDVLEKTIQASVGETVKIQFDATHHFEGTVVRKNQPYSNLTTIVIQASDVNGAVFQLSKQHATKQSSSFSGSILHEKAGVLLRMKKKEKYYSFESMSLNKVLPVCKKH